MKIFLLSELLQKYENILKNELQIGKIIIFKLDQKNGNAS